MIRPIIIGFATLFSSVAFAGQIRTLRMNADSMKSINLRMGQSTIIRFREKPKKVVVGNSNYYAVEFLDSDVTIQPLGKFNTNLFVYTDHHVYGFLLKTSEYGKYDDLVNVRWKAQGIVLKKRSQPKPFNERVLSLNLKLKNVKIHINKVTFNKNRGSHIFDFTVHNVSTKKIREKDIGIYLTRSNKTLSRQEYALEKDEIGTDEKIRGRILVRLQQKKGFTFNVYHGKEKNGVIVSRRFL